MPFDPGAGIHQLGKAGRVRLWKAVLTKPLDLLKDLLGKRRLVPVRHHALQHLVAEAMNAPFSAPGRHGAPQFVGLTGRESRRQHHDLHHLLLKDGHAQGALQCRLQAGRVVHQRGVFSALQVGVHHATLDGPGAHQGHLYHQVVKAGWFQARQHAHLRAALDLEDTDRVGRPHHPVGGLVFQRDVLHPEQLATPLADPVQRLAQGGQHAQGQHVHLHQAQGVQIVLVPLDDAAFGHAGVFNRHHAAQGASGQHEAPCVLAQVTRKTLQGLAQLQPLTHHPDLRIKAHLGQAQRQHLSTFRPVQVLGRAVDIIQRQPQGFAHIAQSAALAVTGHGGGQCRPVAAVLAVQVLDDFFSPFVFKINIDVGRFVALFGDEAFEQQAAFGRVHLGDTQGVAHGRIGRAATALAQDALAAGETHRVVHRQKVLGEAHLGDQGQFFVHLGLYRVRGALGIAFTQSSLGELPEPGIGRLADRHDLVGVFVGQLVQTEGAPRHHVLGGLQQCCGVALSQAHPAAQVAFGMPLQAQAALGHRLPRADGRQHVQQGLA